MDGISVSSPGSIDWCQKSCIINLKAAYILKDQREACVSVRQERVPAAGRVQLSSCANRWISYAIGIAPSGSVFVSTQTARIESRSTRDGRTRQRIRSVPRGAPPRVRALPPAGERRRPSPQPPPRPVICLKRRTISNPILTSFPALRPSTAPRRSRSRPPRRHPRRR